MLSDADIRWMVQEIVEACRVEQEIFAVDVGHLVQEADVGLLDPQGHIVRLADILGKPLRRFRISRRSQRRERPLDATGRLRDSREQSERHRRDPLNTAARLLWATTFR